MSALSFKTPTPFLRKGARTYSLRLRVPKDLLPVYAPKKELTASLKTRDFNEAKENARLWSIRIDQEFREHRRRLTAQREQALTEDASDAHLETASASTFGRAERYAKILRPFADMSEQEQERLLALYPDESLKNALDALRNPPVDDENQALKEWREKQELKRQLEGVNFKPTPPPPFGFPPSEAYKQRLRAAAMLFVEAAPLYLREGDYCTPVLEEAEAFLERHGYALPPSVSDEESAPNDTGSDNSGNSAQNAASRAKFRNMCRRILEAELRVRRLFLAHLNGEPWAIATATTGAARPTTLTPTTGTATGTATATAGATAGATGGDAGDTTRKESPDNPRFSKVCEAYIQEKGAALAPSSLYAIRLTARRFTEQAGDLPIQAYRKREHIIGYKNALLNFPKNIPASIDSLPMPVILERLRKGKLAPQLPPDAPKLAARTINEKYIALVRTVFAYALRNGFIDVNPCDGVKAENNTTGLEDAVAVLPFTRDDLRRIFSSGLYRKGGAGRVGNLYDKGNEKRLQDYRWFVLLALYTGARIEELAQLDREDVKQEENVWYIHIRADAATGRRVKNKRQYARRPCTPNY